MIEFQSLFAISAISFALAFLLTPLVRNVFLRLGIIDAPDGARKLHRHPIPRVGGIPITFSYVAAYAVLLAVPWKAGWLLVEQLPFITRLLPAAALVFVTGLLDDVFGLRPWQKLAGQAAASSVAFWAGVRIEGIAGHVLPSPVGAVLTVIWLIGCANAFNLIDGLDGLASGMGLFATLTIFVAALLQGNHTLALATLPLAGCLLGFLRYNFNPASVFLGDSGSLLIGFLLGCYGVIWSQKSATLLGMTAPAMAMAIPLLDTTLSILRRWLRGRPIFSADRQHIHHRLLDKGLTHRRVVMVLYGVCGIYAALSLLQSLTTGNIGGLILVLFCLVTWIGLQHLGYFEFGVAGRALVSGTVRRVINGQITLYGLERVLQESSSVESCWRGVVDACVEFGISRAEGRLNGTEFADLIRPDDSGSCWRLDVPLAAGDYIRLYRRVDAHPHSAVVAPLVDLLHRRLRPRLVELAIAVPQAVSEATDVRSLLGLADGVRGLDGSPEPARMRSLSGD